MGPPLLQTQEKREKYEQKELKIYVQHFNKRASEPSSVTVGIILPFLLLELNGPSSPLEEKLTSEPVRS